MHENGKGEKTRALARGERGIQAEKGVPQETHPLPSGRKSAANLYYTMEHESARQFQFSGKINYSILRRIQNSKSQPARK